MTEPVESPTGAPRSFADDLPGETLAEKLDALHARHFDGTALTMHTDLWNLVHAFKEDVKKLLPES